MPSEVVENYEPSLRERLGIAAQYIQIGLLMILLFIFFLGPLNILRGETESRLELIAGIIGMLFWAYAASMLASQWPF